MLCFDNYPISVMEYQNQRQCQLRHNRYFPQLGTGFVVAKMPTRADYTF